MKNIKAFLLLVILSCICCTSTSKKKITYLKDNLEFSKNLEEYFLTLKNLKKFNGVVLVKKEGEIIHFKTYNMEEDKESTLYVHKKSQFDIHSISKLMAKAAVVDLELENALSINDYISKFMNKFPNNDIITIQHLIDNQSGLPREFSNEISNLIDKNPEEVVKLIAQEELLFKPGTESMYSNLGYQLLYFIISRIVNKPFVQFLNDRYFHPLKMHNTGAHFFLQNDNLNSLVKNHENDEGEIVVIPNIQSDGKNQAKIYSTVEDLILFIEHFKTEPYLSKIKNNNRNNIGWSGGGDGILSHVEYNLIGNYELAFFSNYDEIPFGDIVKTVEKIMTSQPYELPKKINRKSKEISENILNRYKGKYRVKPFNNQIFEYRVENGKLVFYQDGERGGVLNAETDSTFFDMPDSEDYFEFRREDNGSYKLIFHYKKVELEGRKENGM